MRKLRMIGIIGGVITAVVTIATLTLNGNHPSASSPNPVTAIQPKPEPATSPDGGNPAPGKKPKHIRAYTADGAALAAATANSRLSEAVLLPEQQMRQIVRSTVVPNKQQAVAESYLSAADGLARGLGYQTRSDAQEGANYYVITQKYLVRNFGKGRAEIWLYDITHAVTPPDQTVVQSYAITHPGQTPPGQEYYVPSITIVQMKWLDGRWLWNGTKDPPPDMVPSASGHPTFQKAVEAYLPYTRSFKLYASLSN